MRFNVFSWSYVKYLVYTDKPETIGVLVKNIRGHIVNILLQSLQNVVEDNDSWLVFTRARHRGYF